MADAAPDAQDHGLVKVKLLDPNGTGAVSVGVPVVFIEADGTIAAKPVTGTDGIASADVRPGASATGVFPQTNGAQMYTVLGLKPGDDITLGQVYTQPTQVGTFTVSFPAYSGATSYYVYGPCGSVNTTALSATLTMYSDCKLDTMEILVLANTSSASQVAFIDKPNVAFTVGGNTAVTGTFSTLTSFTASYTNITGVSNISLYRSVPDSREGYQTSASGTVTTATLGLTMNGATGTAATIHSTFNDSTAGQQQVRQVLAGNAQTYSLDVTASLLAWMGQPTLDLVNHKITVPLVTQGTSNDPVDLFLIDAGYSRTVGTTTQSFAWFVFGPTPGDVTLPVLPPDVGDVNPKSTDTANGAFGGFIEADNVAGYDIARQNPFAVLYSINDDRSPATKVRTSTYQGN